jgi:hypothetical protein
MVVEAFPAGLGLAGRMASSASPPPRIRVESLFICLYFVRTMYSPGARVRVVLPRYFAPLNQSV